MAQVERATSDRGKQYLTQTFASLNYIPNISGTKIDLVNGTIDTKNFKVDESGNAILSGDIRLIDNSLVTDATDARLQVEYSGAGIDLNSGMSAYGIYTRGSYNNKIWNSSFGVKGFSIDTYNSNGILQNISVYYDQTLGIGNTGQLVMEFSDSENDSTLKTTVSPSEVWSPRITQYSSQEKKENINAFNKSGIDIVKNGNIYEYNFKGKEEKQIGFVIGEQYNTPKELVDKDKKGIDLYSMCSILWQSQKELIKKVEEQQKTIDELTAIIKGE